MLESAIYNLLKDDATISGIVNTRVYPVLASEQAVEPYLVFNIISAPIEHTLEDSIGMIGARVQVSCWSNGYHDAITLKNAVIDALDNYDGTEPTSSIVFQCIHFEDEGDLIDYTAGADKSKKWGKRLDFKVWYNRE